MLCSGLKDVENRKWRLGKAPGRILIHATKTRVPGYYENHPDDYVSTIKNARLMGQIPEYEEMPYGSIIGYVDCYEIRKDADSFWAEPDSFHWCVRDAYMFDEPIPNITGERGHLFDVDIDENNLPPAHKAAPMLPERKGTHIVMPASDAVIRALENGEKEVLYDLTATNDWLYVDENGENLYETKTIDFVGREKTISKEVESVEIGPYTDAEDKPVIYYGYDGMKLYWSFVAIVIK